MSDDPMFIAAQQRLKILGAARKRAEADLAEYVACGDEMSAGQEIGTIANLDAEAANISNLAARHVAQNTPQQRREKTDTEWQAADVRDMTLKDQLKIFQKSKYAKDMTEDDLRKSFDQNLWDNRQAKDR